MKLFATCYTRIGSSSKLKPVFDNNKVTLRPRSLLKTAPQTPDTRTVLFRIEDTEIEPGEPKIVGFLAIIEPHPNADMGQLLEVFGAVAMVRDDQGELARPGTAVVLVECSGRISSGTYVRPVTEDDGGHSEYSGNSVIEGIRN